MNRYCNLWLTLILTALPLLLWAEGPDDLLNRLTSTGRVNDFAKVFQTNELATLETFLLHVEDLTTVQIAVVTLPSLEGGDLDDFTTRLFEKWGIGRKDKDNGVLLLAAIEDREMKIEVGYGMEGALPDARAGRILDEQVIPSFREGQIARGLTLGAQAIAELAAKEAGVSLTNSVALPIESTTQAVSAMQGMTFIIILLVFFAIVFTLGKKGKQAASSSGGPNRPSSSSRSSSSSSSSHSSSSSSSSRSFGGGRSGGGGASRKW